MRCRHFPQKGVYIYIYIHISQSQNRFKNYIHNYERFNISVQNTTICTFVQCSGQNNKERAKEIFVGIQLIFKVFCAYSYIYSIAR